MVVRGADQTAFACGCEASDQFESFRVSKVSSDNKPKAKVPCMMDQSTPSAVSPHRAPSGASPMREEHSCTGFLGLRARGLIRLAGLQER